MIHINNLEFGMPCHAMHMPLWVLACACFAGSLAVKQFEELLTGKSRVLRPASGTSLTLIS